MLIAQVVISCSRFCGVFPLHDSLFVFIQTYELFLSHKGPAVKELVTRMSGNRSREIIT
jgi:hypothetical protein